MIHHVGIEVARSDLPRSVRFWELLGFTQVEPPPTLADRFTWLERGGTQIHLMHEESPSVPPRAHVAVVAPDFEATLAALREDGFEVTPAASTGAAPRPCDRPRRPPGRADGSAAEARF